MSCDLRNEELNTTNFASLVALSSTLNSDWSQSTSKMLETRDFWRWFASEKAVVLLCAMFVDTFINTTFSIDMCKRDSEPNTDKKGGVDKHENEVSDKRLCHSQFRPLHFLSTQQAMKSNGFVFGTANSNCRSLSFRLLLHKIWKSPLPQMT
ncbi:uncharacterized protein MONOS_18041 [Monocercomonoides exilis]|uniref:uncharacterized protein n=1 Tax=Monocercomonoides exilis TaxID=2049356 RepID=UPI00355A9982|nr:hypothetical protein MONOS_18465 [Monocercomonoides exilis]KAH7818362.1 hypothetical protein MONOS_18041 [Monocercomonoides exilis]